MEREDYMKVIEAQNGYCKCPRLANLYTERKKAEFLSKKCNRLKLKVTAETDLENPRKRDLDCLIEYKGSIIQFKSQTRRYHKKLTEMINGENIELRLYDPKNNSVQNLVNRKERHELLRQGAIITANCPDCKQQIEVLSLNQ